MRSKAKVLNLFFVLVIVLLLIVPSLNLINVYVARTNFVPPPGTVVVPILVSANPMQKNLQLQTFPFVTVTPTVGPISLLPNTFPVTTPRIGGPIPPDDYYCIDDVDPDMCDDNSSYLVPKGLGGVAGTCGTVIENTHKLVQALPQVMKGLRNSLSSIISTSCGSAGPASDYLSTYFVIDAYNLTGFHELSKNNPSHVSPSGLFNWWKSQPSGYKFIPYNSTVVRDFASGTADLTGCVAFLQTGASYHIGIVNKLEQYTANGDGVISILQAGTRMYIDRFPVVGWSIENTSTNQTSTNGVVGFGCRQ